MPGTSSTLSPRKGRIFCFTQKFYHATATSIEHAFDKLNEMVAPRNSCTYFIASIEEGKGGTNYKHYQGFFRFANPVSLGTTNIKRIQKCLHESANAHVELAKGSFDQNFEYVTKGDGEKVNGKWVNHGMNLCIAQGQRRDIQDLYECVAQNETSIAQLCDEGNAALVNKVLQLGEAKRQRTTTRTTMTEGIWIHGPSGCGKSHAAMANYDTNTHYIYNAEDKGWWDGYQGQEVVIMDDFRACNLKFSQLLRIVDRWPFTVPRRHIGPASFLAKKVIITAIAPPEEIYAGIEAYEKWEQFRRRFKVIEMKEREPEPEPEPEPVSKTVSEVGGGNTEAPPTGPSIPGSVSAFSAYDKDFIPSSGYD
ncbi:replication-associated protein [Crucivirus-458]|nr:replication-associated protein [Crucivirus-458]